MTTEPQGPMVELQHGKVRLALHLLREGSGSRPLLLLHGLGERTPSQPPYSAEAWPGPVWGLDLTGHGRSTGSRGGGYSAELLMADADAALAHLGESTVLGRGLGAYVALLVAGARPRLVRGAVLVDGPGLSGGGPSPSTPAIPPIAPVLSEASPDPFALMELSRDVRPPDYALTFVRSAVQLSGLDEPITVSSVVRPPWLEAVAAEPGVGQAGAGEALDRYAARSDQGAEP